MLHAADSQKSMAAQPLRSFAFYKPKPMVTDLSKGADRGGMADAARSMADKASLQELPKPVGQLDKNTTGLMIFTTDGGLAFHLNNHVAKTYRVGYIGCEGTGFKSRTELTEEEIRQLSGGTTNEHGGQGLWLAKEQRHAHFESIVLGATKELEPIRVLEKPTGKKRAAGDETAEGRLVRRFHHEVVVTIRGGAYHVVKRLFDWVGKSVYSLHRCRIGDLQLSDLPLEHPSEFCELSEQQVALLWGSCSLCAKDAEDAKADEPRSQAKFVETRVEDI